MDGRRRITTVGQLELLIEFLEKHRDLALGRVRSKEARALASRLWRDCAEILNADGPQRTGKEWAKVWNDQKCRVRAKLVSINANQQATGGGPGNAPVLTPLEERVAGILTRDVGALPNVRQEQLISNDDDATVVAEDYQEMNVSRNVSESISSNISEASSVVSSPAPSVTGRFPTSSRVARDRQRRSNGRTPRQPDAFRAQAQSRQTALEELRSMILKIERMKAEAELKTAEAISSFADSFKTIAMSIDRMSRMFCQQQQTTIKLLKN